MTLVQARLLILVLSAQRIPFTFRRKHSRYVVAFASGYTDVVSRAIGA